MTTIWLNYFLDESVNNLAKFGYILDVKVENKQKPFYILGYLLELIIKIWQFRIFLKNLANVGHLFHEKSFT
jgi:hypothetical protein